MKNHLTLNDIKIFWLNGGEFELDGGTMFGAVPKRMWSKKYPPDINNYIRLLNSPLLVITPDHTVLIDTGLGNKLTPSQKKIFRVTREWSLDQDLANLSIGLIDIDYVILTHCDFDHAGGVVMRDKNGKTELTFPKAQHIIQKKEWDDVQHTNSRSAHTYWKNNFAGLANSGLLQIISSDMEIVPGVTVRHTGGHTRGHQLVEITSGTKTAVHLADLLPTHTHFNPLWIMAYDNYPLKVIELKENLLQQYTERNCWFTFYHDIHMKACRLNKNGSLKDTLQD